MILSRPNLSEECVPWLPPVISKNSGEATPDQTGNQCTGEAASLDDSSTEPTFSLEELEVQLESAKTQSYEKGYAQGKRDAKTDHTQELIRLSNLMDNMQKPLGALNREIADELARLAVLVAKVIIRRELKDDVGYYRDLINSTLSELVEEPANAVIKMNPDDARLLAELPSTEREFSLSRVTSDAALPHGTCLIETKENYIDLSIETILVNIAEQIELNYDGQSTG